MPFDTRAPALGCTRDRARFSTRFRFESDQQKFVIALSLGIGKAISLKAREARSSRRSSSVNRAMCCWCDYRARIRTATNLTDHRQAQLDAIAWRLNTRPRLTLGYQTPAAKLAEIVAATG